MPVVINELVIRAVVDTGAGGGNGARPGVQGEGGSDKESIIAECVDQVLQILEQKRER
jgi:hypothetical protein